jgi:hypothetical protein
MAGHYVSWAELSAAIAANPLRSAGCDTGAASRTVAALPPERRVTWLPSGWTEETTFAAADVLSFALWIQHPIYRAAAAGVRRQMEVETASTLLKEIDANWRKHHGKARGWVRKHLEEDLRSRAAGGDPAPDGWTGLRTTRRVALLADYIAVVLGLRIGIWWPTSKTVSMLPLSGLPASTGVAQLNAESGNPLLSPTAEALLRPPTAWPDLVTGAVGIHWAPPACAPSAGSSTVAQIQERLESVVGKEGPRRSGSRPALWSILQWEMLVQDLAGLGALLSDDSVGSTSSGIVL